MADNSVNIGINTTANLAGATAARESLGALTMTVDRFVSQTDKARVSEWGFHNLDEVPRKVRKLTNEIQESGRGFSRAGSLWAQAGIQLGDFTTQVGMGTSAARAFSMQAPQMLGQLATAGVVSTKMALAFTGIGAAIPLLVTLGPAIMSFFGGTAETADEAAKKVEGLGEKLAKIEAEKTAKIIENIDLAEQRAIALGTTTGEVRQAQEAAAKAELSNAEKLAQAEANVNVILGIRLDQFRQLREANERAEKARQAELKAQRDAAAEAAKNLQVEMDAMNAAKSADQARIDDLKAIQADLAKRRETQYERVGRYKKEIADDPGFGSDYVMAPGMTGKQSSATGAAAKAESARTQLPGAEKLLGEIDKKAVAAESEMKRLEQRITAKQAQIDDKAKELAAKTEAAQIGLESLVQTQAADRTLELTETARKNQESVTGTLTTLRDDLQKAAEQQGGLSMSAARALTLLNQTLQNNQVDETEVGMVREAMQQILQSNEAVRGSVLGGFTRLHQENLTFKAQIDALEREMKEVRKLVPK